MAGTRPRRGVWRLLAIVLAAAVLLAGLAVLAVIAMFDADSAKPRIVAAVLAATGRELVIAGPIRLVPGLLPSLELTDATLSNPPGFSRPQMAVLKRLDLQVALMPLLHRRIEIDRLIIHGADILLELNAAGVGNWRFTPLPGEKPPAEKPDAQTAVAAPANAASPAIRVARIEIDDGQIGYRNARMVAPVVLAIRALSLTTEAPDQPIRLAMTAAADGVALTLSGSIGPSDALFAGPDRPLNLDLTLASAGASFSAVGTIADPARLSGADLRLGADIPDLAALSGLVRTPLAPLRAISAHTRLTDLAGKPGLFSGFTLHDLQVVMPQAGLDGEVSVTRGSLPLLQGRLHAARIDADAFRAALSAPASAPPATAAPPPAPASAQPASNRLISDQDLPLDALREVDADLTVAVDELIQGGVPYRDLALRLVLNNAVLRLDPFTLTPPGGKMRVTLAIDAGKPAPPVAVTIAAPSLSLVPLLAAFRLPPHAQGNLRLEADLHGAGRSLHQIAATLDGSIGLSMENAQIDTRMLGEALNSVDLLKNGKAGFTALRCLAARMDTKNGIGTLRALLLDTAPVRLSGTGGLNLGEETLAIRLQATVRLGATGIGAPLDLGGSFRAPKVRIDAAMPEAGAVGKTPFGLVIGKLGLEQLGQGASGDSCAHDLAIARGETPPLEQAVQPGAEPAKNQPGAKPPKPADLLRQLLR